MIKNKIAAKLSLYFLTILLFFSLILGSLFFFFFQSYTVDLHRSELERRATKIASTLAEWDTISSSLSAIQPGNHSMKRMTDHNGYGAYLRFLDDIAMSDVWIVNSQKQLITPPQRGRKAFIYSDLPPSADQVIQEVFQGKSAFSQDFSSLISAPTLTVGTPIIDAQGKVQGVVLLHSPISGITEILRHSFLLLGASLLVALIFTLALAIKLSYRFTNPLNKMRGTALQLAEGDYLARNNLQLHDEIGQLANAMDLLSDHLLEASKEKAKLDQFRKDFIINLSHELRTPVTVIRGSLEALVDKIITSPEQITEYHKQMLAEAILLQRLIGDLLEISKLENEDFPIEKMALNLWEPLDEAIRSANALAQNKAITIHVEKDSTPYCFYGDYGRLKQLFLIILDNAVKFSPSDSTIEVTQKGNTIVIEDHGLGISPEELPYIFDRFYQASTHHFSQGSGLGLAIAKQIAQRHGIEILATSSINSGMRFELHFP